MGKLTQFLFTIFILLSCSVIASPDKSVGRVISVRGSPEIIKSDKTIIQASLSTPIYQGDLLRTGGNSSLKVVFIDGTKFNLFGKSELLIKEYLFSRGRDPQAQIELKKGWVDFLVEGIAKFAPQNFEIETPTATIGIRGSGGKLFASDQLLFVETIPNHTLIVTPHLGSPFDITKPNQTLVIDSYGAIATLPSLKLFSMREFERRVNRLYDIFFIYPFPIKKYPVYPYKKNLPIAITLWKATMKKKKKYSALNPEIEGIREIALEPETSTSHSALKKHLVSIGKKHSVKKREAQEQSRNEFINSEKPKSSDRLKSLRLSSSEFKLVNKAKNTFKRVITD